METTFFIEKTPLIFDSKLSDVFSVASIPSPYNVEISDKNITDIFSGLLENDKNFFLVDKNVYNLFFNTVQFKREKVFKILPIEENKTITTALEVIQWLEESNFTKNENLVVVGGGITQDIGAFVAACFKRGIPWIFFPTTILSMCDSCIGGKTGINHNDVKNQLALFSAPTSVTININFIKTLDEREILSGTGEILKLLITGGPEALVTFDKLTANGKIKNFSLYTQLIKAALAVKKSVIELDEFEKLYRKSLNYGHTLGHALESSTNYAIPHGLAVAAGVLAINKIACDLGFLNENVVQKIRNTVKPLLKKITTVNLDPQVFKTFLQKDKKNVGKFATLIMISDLGDTFFYKQEISDTFAAYAALTLKEEIEFCNK